MALIQNAMDDIAWDKTYIHIFFLFKSTLPLEFKKMSFSEDVSRSYVVIVLTYESSSC